MHKLEEKEEIESTYEYFMSFKKELEKDKNLENHMRNIIIIEFSILLNSKGLDKFKNLNFKYYNTNSIENDSPLKKAMKFLVQFIKDLDENSPFIYPLILIDSGNYQFDKENAYGYGLISIKILKSHLENVLPDIIITITDIETKSKICERENCDDKTPITAIDFNYSGNLLAYASGYDWSRGALFANLYTQPKIFIHYLQPNQRKGKK